MQASCEKVTVKELDVSEHDKDARIYRQCEAVVPRCCVPGFHGRLPSYSAYADCRPRPQQGNFNAHYKTITLLIDLESA